MAAPRIHALLVGVDQYIHLHAREQLGGCVNDIAAVREFLRTRVGVDDEDVRCLTAPTDGASASPASAANIRAAMLALRRCERLRAGDHLVLYLAGHGVRVEQLVTAGICRHFGFAATDFDRAAGLVNLILDREVRALLDDLAGRSVTASVIVDACHSGNAYRSTARGEGPRIRSLRLQPLERAAWDELRAAHGLDASVPGPAQHLGVAAGDNFVALAACRDDQTAIERNFTVAGADGSPRQVRYGVLTRALLTELARVPDEQLAALRWIDFKERLLAAVAFIGARRQTPALEGLDVRPVFGGAWQARTPGFTVDHDADGALLIDAGTIQGLDVGAVLEIRAADADSDETSAPAIQATVVAAELTRCRVAVDPAARLPAHARARLVVLGSSSRPLFVRIVERSAALAGIVGTIEPRGFRFTEDGDCPAQLEVRPWSGEVPDGAWKEPARWRGARDGWVIVATGSPKDILAYLPGEGPHVAALRSRRMDLHAGLGGALSRALAGYARYLRLRERPAVDPALADMLSLDLRADEEVKSVPAFAAVPARPRVGDDYAVTIHEQVCVGIRVARVPASGLQIGLLLFGDDGSVTPLWPQPGATTTYRAGDALLVGADRQKPLQIQLRGDRSRGRCIIRAIACSTEEARPVQFAGMRERPIHAEVLELLTRTRHAKGVALRSHGASWFVWDLPLVLGR